MRRKKERLVAILERGQADELLEVVLLAADVLELEGELLLERHDVESAGALQAEPVSSWFGEGARPCLYRVAQQRSASERRCGEGIGVSGGASHASQLGHHHGCRGMGHDVLRDAVPDQAIDGVEAPRPDHDRVEARPRLRSARWSGPGRRAARAGRPSSPTIGQEALGLPEFAGVRLAAVPRLGRRRPVAAERDHGDDAEGRAERDRELRRRLEGAARDLATVVREKDFAPSLSLRSRVGRRRVGSASRGQGGAVPARLGHGGPERRAGRIGAGAARRPGRAEPEDCRSPSGSQ